MSPDPEHPVDPGHLFPPEGALDPPYPTDPPLYPTEPAAGTGPPDADLWFDEPGEPGGESDTSTTRGRRGVKPWVAAGLGAVMIVAGSVVGINVASSQTSASGNSAGTSTGAPGGATGPGGMGAGAPGAFGTVVGVSGSTLTITARSGTKTEVATTPATVVTTAATGSISSIRAGDHVVVMGTTSGTEVAAQQIADQGSSAAADTAQGAGGAAGGFGGPGGTGARAPITGTVSEVAGSTITVASSTGTTYTVTTSSSTTVTVEKTASLSSLTAGEQVVVEGTTSNGVVTATRIRAGDTGFGAPPGQSGAGGTGGTPPSGKAPGS